MTRRNIFHLACCAVAASAMEVCGWEGINVSIRTMSDLIHRVFNEMDCQSWPPVGTIKLPDGRFKTPSGAIMTQAWVEFGELIRASYSSA